MSAEIEIVASLPEAIDAPLTRSDLLASLPYVRHGLTRRVAGLGRADGNVGYSPPRDQSDAWAMRRLWCEAAGLDAERIVTMGQVHGADVIRARPADAGLGARPGSGRIGLGDALIADEPGVVLLTLHADCLPILLVDPDRPAVAAIHAGWRGTVAGVAGATVRAMTDAFGSRPDRLLAYLGPGIGNCCYTVGEEVASAWVAHSGTIAPQAVRNVDGALRFDLRAGNLALLRHAGLDPARIETSTVCTRCRGDEWFSHRGQGATTGRFGAFIALTPQG